MLRSCMASMNLDHHWFGQWLGAKRAPSHYPNQWWPVLFDGISLGQSELILPHGSGALPQSLQDFPAARIAREIKPRNPQGSDLNWSMGKSAWWGKPMRALSALGSFCVRNKIFGIAGLCKLIKSFETKWSIIGPNCTGHGDEWFWTFSQQW